MDGCGGREESESGRTGKVSYVSARKSACFPWRVTLLVHASPYSWAVNTRTHIRGLHFARKKRTLLGQENKRVTPHELESGSRDAAPSASTTNQGRVQHIRHLYLPVSMSVFTAWGERFHFNSTLHGNSFSYMACTFASHAPRLNVRKVELVACNSPPGSSEYAALSEFSTVMRIISTPSCAQKKRREKPQAWVLGMGSAEPDAAKDLGLYI